MKRRDFLAQTSTFSLGTLSMPMFGLTAMEPAAQPAPLTDTNIASLAIYPPIGMSRVGNLPASDKSDPTRADILAGQDARWFYAPEVPGGDANPSGQYKAGPNQVKKQVQRYRIYALNSQKEVIGELVTDVEAAVKAAVKQCPDVDPGQVQKHLIQADAIEWNFHIANTKAAWYNFNNPAGLGDSAPYLPGQVRNQSVTGKEAREGLVINPGAKTLRAGEDRVVTMDGQFGACFNPVDNKPKPLEQTVNLGTAITDDAGRLLIFAADGHASSVVASAAIESFTSNDGWYDDWADGWVTGKVRINGKDYSTGEDGHGWIACCGPDFAPAIPPFVTLYDVAYDTMYRKDLVAMPKEPSFTRDIYPFFRRLALMEWIANSANLRQAWLNTGDFTDPEFIGQLAKKSNSELRKTIFSQFRGYRVPVECGDEGSDTDGEENVYSLAFMLGSGVNYSDSPDHYFRMPKYHFDLLIKWRDGDYVDDWKGEPPILIPNCVEALPPAEQVRMLSRAALEPCSGTGFHPGVELTWPLEQTELYSNEGLFRIRIDKGDELQEDLGRLLTVELALCNTLGPQKAGNMTRWMGIPWQPDAFSCQWVLYGTDFPVSIWWPALLPIDVLPEALYQRMACAELPVKERLKFFFQRFPWSRGVAGIGYHADGSYLDGLNNMVQLWPRMGFVVPKPRPWSARHQELRKLPNPTPEERKELADIDMLNTYVPETIFVETQRGSMDELNVDQPYQVPPCPDKAL